MADYRKIRAQVWRSWLDVLPEEIYDKRETAHIVRLMDALCGDSGVGYVRKRLMLKRLQTTLYETRYIDLDTVYSKLFGLPRLSSEQYKYSEDSLLAWSEIQEMDIKDAHYRMRIWNYMLSFQYGGTLKGVALAAQAATGLPCSVIDGNRYYTSTGVFEKYSINVTWRRLLWRLWDDVRGSVDGSDSWQLEEFAVDESTGIQGAVSGQPINWERIIDFNGATIIVDSDSELTSEQMYNLSTVTSRLRPVDVRYTFMTRGELMKDLCFVDMDDEVLRPKSAVASSRWWGVTRYVTGRPDWGVDGWIEANVTKEAPQQLLVNSQESEYDFTHMVTNVTASSEHVGSYNRYQRGIFESLDVAGAETTKGARNALSQASSRGVGNGYYGDEMIIDGAYPESYSSQLIDFFLEVGRSHRFWSSAERRYGTEFIEVEFGKLVPINNVSFCVFRKPLNISVYFSSFSAENGERVWIPARDRVGNRMSFTYREWGSTAGGETVMVEFDVYRSLCDAVRIEFERIDDVAYYESIGDGLYDSVDFSWSVECSDLSLKYKISEEDDFIEMTYKDMFGNRVDTKKKTFDANLAIDGDDGSYWISQPNVAETAVEYLILKVSDKPVRVNYMDIDAIYSGCQMNIYSTQDDEPGSWVPYSQVYVLNSGRYDLPLRKVTYIKLEFTNLFATPYDVSSSHVPVKTRSFPWVAKKYIEDRTTYTYEQTREQQLLSPPSYAIYDDGSMESAIGIDDVYRNDDYYIDENSLKNRMPLRLYAGNMYGMFQDNVISGIYGDDTDMESYNIPSPDATSFGTPSVAYRFSEPGVHEYDIGLYDRTNGLAYVVGVRDVVFGFSGRVFSTEENGAFLLYMQDQRFIDVNDGWGYVNDERMSPLSDSRLNYFETVDLQSIFPFRSFEMVSNQQKPVEKFAYPSDMSREWHGNGASVESVDFGLSGTVLMAKMSGAHCGIESEPKLTRSMSIAKAQVDVYPLSSGKWNFECDDIFGESIFSLTFELEREKWQTVGATFVPTPGGTWWDYDYQYRVMLPIKGPIAEGTHVFMPVVDLDAMRNSTPKMLDDDCTKLRVVYFNGTEVKELPIDISDNMEIWFRVQQTLPMGKSADGKYDFDNSEFYGSYYLYFGDVSAEDEPKRNFRDVFDSSDYVLYQDDSWGDRPIASLADGSDFNDAFVVPDGTYFLRDDDRAEFDNEFFLPDSGFITFEFTPNEAMTVASGDGVADVRFMLDYTDAWKSMQVYVRDGQLFFVIKDAGGFESSFVSRRTDLFEEGLKSHVLVQWGVKGSAEVMVADVIKWEDVLGATYGELQQHEFDFVVRDAFGLQTSTVDPESKSRRWVGAWVDSSTQLECVQNVYDEMHYLNANKSY